MRRHGWQIVTIAAFALAVTACGSKKENEGPSRWESFPVTIYTDPTLIPNAEARQDFTEAMAYWENTTGMHLFDYRGDFNGDRYNNGDSVSQNSLYLQNPWNYASNIAAQTIVLSRDSLIEGAVIMVNPNTDFCPGDCAGQNYRTSMKKVFAHELGHFIGLSHNDDSGNIMYPDALPGGDISGLSVDVSALSQLVK